MGKLTFITGPVRSGKSQWAVRAAEDWGKNVVFVATYRADPRDQEMAERVRRHQAERPGWRTLEAPEDAVAGLKQLSPAPSGVIFDCLTLWASDRFSQSDEHIVRQWSSQLTQLKASAWPTIIVSNELGWSLVPPDASARRFRDLTGTLAQATASAADEAWLLVAGCGVRLK